MPNKHHTSESISFSRLDNYMDLRSYYRPLKIPTIQYTREAIIWDAASIQVKMVFKLTL